MSSIEIVTSKSYKLKFLFSQVGKGPPSAETMVAMDLIWTWLWCIQQISRYPDLPSYRVSCYVSHRYASEDAVSEIGFFLR